MSTKAPGQTTVLRQPEQGNGGRRLPVGSSVAPTPPAPALDVLRVTFAQELAELHQQAHAQGLAQAREAFAKQAAAELAQQQQAWLKQEAALREALASQRAQLVELASQLEQQRVQMTASMTPVIGRLALAVVVRLLGQHAPSRSLVADMAGQAIEAYQLQTPLRIRVAAADYATLTARMQADPLALFQPDPVATPGSCLIDHGIGQLDASLDTQLAALKALLAADTGGDDHVAGV
ncbi:FliH/SctL family protein [Pseudomonas sp. LF242]